MTTTIIGAGSGGKGGGGSSRTPRTDRDSLDSREFANVTEVIAEGEIEGLANGHQSVFFNDTALQNADGTYNFQDVDLHERTGTANQDLIPLDSSTKILSASVINIPVKKAFPVVQTISDSSVDAARIIITIPALQKINNENGDTLGTHVQLKISVQYTNISSGEQSGFLEVIDDTIRGRTADAYNRQYEIKFNKTKYPNSNYTIQVERVTDDSTDSMLSNAFVWNSLTSVKFSSQTYENTALIGVRLDAQQFSSIPTRKYDIKGLKVQIPTGVTVDSETGRIIYPTNFVWDGTFQAATWTSCPSWLLYALMLNKRFGLGDHFDSSQLDKWAFFRASKHANELVPNGFGGGEEARFSCNATINSTSEAFDVVNQLLSVMRSQGFWEDGSLSIGQDAPADPIYSFNQSNVTEEGFSYTNTSNKNKPTVVVVAYLDLVLKDRAYEVVKDIGTALDSNNRDLTKNGEAKRGIIKKSVTAFGCTSRAQANRLGKWILYEENNSEVITFTSNLVTAQLLRPGVIISVADPLKSGERRAGRTISGTINSILVDSNIDIEAINVASSYPKLGVILPDGTFDKWHDISGIGGYCFNSYWAKTYDEGNGYIQTNTNFQAIPEANSGWVLETSDLKTTLWRVIGIKEEEDFLYTVQAVSYDPSKYDLIEKNIALTPRDTTNLNVIPARPQNVQVLNVPRLDGTTTKELQYELNGRIAVKVTFHWEGVAGVDRYRVKWRHEDDNYITQIVNNTTIDLFDVKKGTYQVQVSSISSTGILYSSPAKGAYDVAGLGGDPVDISGLSMVPISETLAVLSWQAVTQLDVKLGGQIIIRHDPRTSGASWLTSNKIVDGVSGASTQKQVPLLAGTYFVKAQDYLGNKSKTPATFITTLPEATRRLNVITWSEEVLFTGRKVNTGLKIKGNNLVLSPKPYVSSGYHNPFYADGDERSEYIFATASDYGHAGVQYDAVLRKEVISNSIRAEGLTWDSRTGLFDDASGLFDGDVIDEANVDLYVRTSSLASIRTATYAQSGTTITVTYLSGHGFVDGDEVEIINTNGNIESGFYLLTVTSSSVFTCIAFDPYVVVDYWIAGYTEADRGSQTTSGSCTISPPWGKWAEFEAAIVRSRSTQVKAVITSNNTDAEVSISNLGATLDLLGRTDSASVEADGLLPDDNTNPLVNKTGTGVYAVTFEKAFYDTPQVQITPNASSSNLFVSVSSLSRTGFTATFNNGSNVDTAFMYTVTGFGRAI